ncbi:hypothetical protein Avbf_19196 [Armadillidium vulgare]|nr:hypothetical protein Avbf_19196 [Armadillidium vulgare]
MAYEIEGQEKRLRAYYSHLKVWAEPPPYLAEYFDRYRYYQNITEDLRNKDIVEVTQKIVMSEESREVGSHFLRATKKVKQIESKPKKGSALKEAWKALKGLACDKTREKQNACTQTEKVNYASVGVQVDDLDTALPLAEQNELCKGSMFNIQEFENSLKVPDEIENLHTPCPVDNGNQSSDLDDDYLEIVELAKELGIESKEDDQDSIEDLMKFLDGYEIEENNETCDADQDRAYTDSFVYFSDWFTNLGGGVMYQEGFNRTISVQNILLPRHRFMKGISVHCLYPSEVKIDIGLV